MTSAAPQGGTGGTRKRAPLPPVPVDIVDLGLVPYRDAYQRQLDLVEERKGDADAGDVILLLEHPHVITLGRSQKARANVLAAGDVEVVEIERGGDVTYHGPGQLVAYPIIRLRPGEQDLHAFLRHLEQGMIDTLARYGLDAGRVQGKTGVWIGPRKIASIGVACRRWITFHGLALNVTTDLSYFRRINPCGFEAGIMTSMDKELGRPVPMDEVKGHLAADLARALGRTLPGER